MERAGIDTLIRLFPFFGSVISSGQFVYIFMTSLSQDTPPEIERLMIEGYRRMTGAQKLCIMQDLNRAARLLALGDIQRQYPNASEREIRLRLASRWIEPELMKKAFGWDVEVEGY